MCQGTHKDLDADLRMRNGFVLCSLGCGIGQEQLESRQKKESRGKAYMSPMVESRDDKTQGEGQSYPSQWQAETKAGVMFAGPLIQPFVRRFRESIESWRIGLRV
jgi:hypothetical protein